MEKIDALRRLAGWLLVQDSLVARWLTRYPHLLAPDLLHSRPGRLPPPPPLPARFDEEAALADLRRWLAEGLVSLCLAALFGRLSPSTLAERCGRLTALAVDRSLSMADLSLRQRFNHPLLLPPEVGPGPISVLAWGDLALGQAVFDQPVGLLFIFSRRPSYAGPHREADLAQALTQPREMVILREYVLKASQKVITYLTLDHPAGPGIKPAAPEGGSPALVGTQINSLASFQDFFSHQADAPQLFGLTRMDLLAGQERLGREALKTARRTVLGGEWTGSRLARTISRLRSEPEGEFDPRLSPGGLHELSLLLDGLLLRGGFCGRGPVPARLKKARELGLIDPDLAAGLSRAHQTLLRAHICRSLVDREPEGPADLEAALALWPAPTHTPPLSLSRAMGLVRKELDKLVEEEGKAG